MYSKQPLLRPVTAVVGTRGGGADGRGPCACPPGERAGKQGRTSTRPPPVRSTAPLVPTTIIKRGDGNEHRTSSADWEIRVTGTPGTWWHGGGLESAGYAIATPCGYQAAAC